LRRRATLYAVLSAGLAAVWLVCGLTKTVRWSVTSLLIIGYFLLAAFTLEQAARGKEIRRAIRSWWVVLVILIARTVAEWPSDQPVQSAGVAAAIAVAVAAHRLVDGFGVDSQRQTKD
jgi:ABC-type transport system involved in cytochrome bd biosynthesis fused ATPase/permease subunit